MTRIRKKSGFNLAEVLITLGIIGIVASMTIPTMLADIQQEQNVKTWHIFRGNTWSYRIFSVYLHSIK